MRRKDRFDTTGLEEHQFELVRILTRSIVHRPLDQWNQEHRDLDSV